jgi:hypothetical protein
VQFLNVWAFAGVTANMTEANANETAIFLIRNPYLLWLLLN